MKYIQSQSFTKIASSLGQYAESISIQLAKIAISKIKNLDIEDMVETYEETGEEIIIHATVSDAINNTNIPSQMKGVLISKFSTLRSISISIKPSKLEYRDDSYREDKKVWLGGGSAYEEIAGSPQLLVDMEINADIITSISDCLQDIYQILCYTIRHEIEHIVQYLGIDIRNEVSTKNPAKYEIDQFDTHNRQEEVSQNPLDYYLSSAEIEAYVSQIYMTAKKKKIPFEQELNYVVYGQINNDFLVYLYQEISEGRLSLPPSMAEMVAKKEVEKVKLKYLQYAKSRYPNAQLDPKTINDTKQQFRGYK